jgi:hypothetical protein
MFAKLESIEKKYEELEAQLADPSVFDDQERYRKLTKSHSDLGEIVRAFREYRTLDRNLAENREMFDRPGPGNRQMARAEADEIRENLPRLEERLRILLLPKDPLDDKNIILEIRAGTGGEEAALFAADLFRMYSRFAETKGWRLEVLSSSDTAPAVSRKSSPTSPATRSTASSSTSRASIACSASRPRNPRAASTPPPLPWPSCPRPRRSRWSCAPRSCASTCSARRAPAARA